jgi:hypothetical protein
VISWIVKENKLLPPLNRKQIHKMPLPFSSPQFSSAQATWSAPCRGFCVSLSLKAASAAPETKIDANTQDSHRNSFAIICVSLHYL